MAQKKDKLREWASHLYINVGLTQKAIAEHIGVSEPTVGKWKKEDLWEEERTRLSASPRKIKTLLLEELQKVSEGQKTSIDADALSKITKALDTLDGKISIQVIYDVLRELDKFTSEEDPQLAVRNLDMHKKFMIFKINQDG